MPSILSSDKMIIIDPNLKYLTNHVKNQSKPGLLINLNSDRVKLAKYKDQLKPYVGIFGIGDIVDINNNQKTIDFDGAIFRLPFRKTISGLSSVLYSKERAKCIFKILIENSENLLLSTLNICKLELYTLSEDVELMDLFFSIEKNGQQFIRNFDHRFQIKNICNDKKLELMEVEPKIILLLILELIDSKSKSVEKRSIFVHEIKVALFKSKIFPELEENYSNSYWFQIVSCFSRPLELSYSQSEKVLPCTAISFKVIPNEAKDPKFTLFMTYNNRSVFCLLPLPSKTELDFKVIGNIFSMIKREDIIVLSKDRIGEFESSWNDHLQACLAVTLINCCEVLAKVVDYDMNQLINLWQINTKFLKFEKYFNNKNFDHNTKKYSIFKNEQRSYSIDKCKILNLTFNKNMIYLAKDALQNIFDKECFITRLPEKLSKYLDDKKIILKNKINDYEFCQKFIENINKIPLKKALEMINYLLKEYVCEKSGAFTKIGLFLKDKPFLPTNLTAIYRKTNELISENSNLIDLYDPQIDDVFTNDELFRNNEKILIKMGLIHEYLPSDMILERAMELAKNSNLKYDCWVLLNHFVTTFSMEGEAFNAKEYREKISNIKFLKAKMKCNFNKELIWYSDIHHDKLWSLNELYSDKNQQLIFRVCPIFDADKLHFKNSVNLLNLKPDNNDNFIQQCIELQKDWFKKSNNLAGTELYKYNLKFIEWLSYNLDAINSEGLPKNILFFNFCNNYEYFNVNNIALDVKYPNFPYLIKLPKQFHHFSNVLKKLNIQQTFSSNYLKGKLNEIHSMCNNSKIDMSKAELCINIIKELDRICDLKAVRQEIYLPDKDLILRKSSDLCVQDEKSSKYKVHYKIPIYIAKKLEIIPLQIHLIKNLMQGFSFGQKESLVIRIKKILESYPNFFDIFKELIQNADDCGASEISFILDTRQHGCTKIFSRDFMALQGPAILCYNDKIFTESDLNALKVLGVGSKAANKCTIGKYGIGFNCVYRLTDAPQIMSNLDNWLIFDPLCEHFHGLIDSSPGYRIPFDINDSANPFSQYDDVIDSFKGDFQNINQLAKGTMFRFALREKESAIHDKVFTPYEIEWELRHRSNDFKNCLIFLKSIRKLKLTKINRDGQVEEIFHYEKEFPTQNDKTENSNFRKFLTSSSVINFQQIRKQVFQYNLKINNLIQKENMSFHIINQIGFENVDISFTDCANYFPFGSIAIPLINEPCEFNGSLYCFLPLPIPCSMPYHINGYFALANESRQSLFMMSDLENEKIRWNKHLFNDIISNLMLEGLIYMKIIFEDKFKKEKNLIEECYLKYLPSLETNKNFFDSTIYIEDMERNFYTKFLNSEVNLIPIYKLNDPPKIEWVNIKSSDLTSSYDLFEWSHEKSSNNAFYDPLCNVLIRYGFKMCTFLKLVDVLNDVSKKVLIKPLNGTNILNFFNSYDEELGLNISKTRFNNHFNLVKLIKFSLRDKLIHERECCLNNRSLFLDASEKVIKFSSKSPILKYDNLKVFSGCLEKFMHPSFSNVGVDVFTRKINIEDLTELLPFIIDKAKYYISMSNDFNFESYPIADEEILKKLKDIWIIVERVLKYLGIDFFEKYTIIDEHLYNLSRWALIPVKFSNNEKILLAPINSLNLILTDIRCYNDKSISKAEVLFSSLNLPFIARYDFPLLTSISMNCHNLEHLSSIFNFIIINKIELINALSSKERFEYLKYLTSQLCEYITDYEDIKKIMSLKLFENLFGEIISIERKTSIIIDSEIPLNGLQQVFPSSTYFLTYAREDSQDIYKKLKKETCNVQTFYEENLFKLNRSLSFQDKNAHLIFIKDFLSQNLLKELESFDFIKTSEGEVLSAKLFFDPDVKFFKIIYRNDPNKFPTQPYNTDAWMPLLRRIGLNQISKLNKPSSINEYLQLAIVMFNHDNLNDSLFLFAEQYKIIINFHEEEILTIISVLKTSIEFIAHSINIAKIENINIIKPIFDQIYLILKYIFVKINSAKVFQFFESIKKTELSTS